MKPMNRMMRLLFDPMILAVSAATLKLYNVSITDQSPLISYSPATIGDGTTSWNISYTGSPWTSFQTGQYNEGVGQSYHWTEAALAYASFSFTGSAVYAMGNSTSGVAYFVVDGVDGTAMGNTTGILAAAEGLEMGLHKVQFSWKGGLGRVNLTGFTFTVGIGSLGSSISNTQLGVLGNYGNTSINTALTLSAGDWGISYDGSELNNTTPSLETFHPYATVGFTPPVNTSLLLVFGSVSPVSGPYSVLLSTTSSISSNYTSPANQSYTSSTPWGENAVILYLANLDPTAQYSLQMEYLGTTGAGLGISSALFVYATGGSSTSSTSQGSPVQSQVSSIGSQASSIQASASSVFGGSSSSSNSASPSHAGPIAGGVVGGLAFILLGILLLWFLRRRRGRNGPATRDTAQAPFDVDEYREAPAMDTVTLTPYADNASAAYANAAGITRSDEEEPHEEKLLLRSSSQTRPTNSTYATRTNGTSSEPDTNQLGSGLNTRTLPSSNTRTPPSSNTRTPPSSNTRTAEASSLFPSPMTLRSTSDQTKPSRRAGVTRSSQNAAPQPVHDVDAGTIQGNAVELLPPNYDPAWSRNRS